MIRLFVAVLWFVACASGGHASAANSERPYAALRQAYAALDARAAAAVYRHDAVYEETYPDHPRVVRRGQVEIEAGFERLFEALKPLPGEAPLDLNFRLTARRDVGGVLEDEGYFRLRHGPGEGARRNVIYGRFATRHQDGLFLFDHSSPADLAAFETTAGPVLLASDEELLAPEFYDALLGVYRSDGGRELRITRSQRGLFAFDESVFSWRALTRENGFRWRAGARLLDSEGATAHYTFTPDGALLARSTPHGPSTEFRRDVAITRRPIRFHSGQLTLAGTIVSATDSKSRRPGIVLVHGSGPQDRHGYASVIEFLAMEFAQAGYVVLTYDKRGVGASGGDWTRAGFEHLASDAGAALATLRAEPGVDPNRVGLGGSSQAGWVAAKAIEQGSAPAFVFLLGAAGAAMTVEEQNQYNTRVQMQCAGLNPAQIALALEQQQAFFSARGDPALLPALTQASQRAQAVEVIRPWLFPSDPARVAAPEWYDVLETRFDPLPIWRSYPGEVLFLFGAFDPSTDVALAAKRLAALPAAPWRAVVTVPGAEHLGLATSDVCTDLAALDGFAPATLRHLRHWARAYARR